MIDEYRTFRGLERSRLPLTVISNVPKEHLPAAGVRLARSTPHGGISDTKTTLQ
ncbi:MAG: hypothetical protein ISS16_00075 [Ignavibacteria bacterium]|nr:hypothetical protein [Ignavibacteria bacterium]